MDNVTRKLFDIIFQESHVIDFDFSQWDKRVRLVVVGGLVEGNFEGAGPIHNVDFVDAFEVIWKGRHVGIELDSPDQHCQWVIMAFKVEFEADNIAVTLRSVAPPCPELTIRCGRVEITEIDQRLIDLVNPRWNRPYCPLARPSLKELGEIAHGEI